MSNIKFLLQSNLQQIDSGLYEESKIQEIILLVKAIQSGIIDYQNYEIYFDRKCLTDYKDLLINEITRQIEPSITNQNKAKQMKIYKVLFLFKLKLESNALTRKERLAYNKRIKKELKIPKELEDIIVDYKADLEDNDQLKVYLNKIVKKSDLLSSYAPYKSLQKKIDINKENKNKEEVSRLQKEKLVLEKKIIDISVSAITDMFEENNLDYNYIINNINNDDLKILKNVIFHMVNYHGDRIGRLQISDMHYLDLLTSNLSSYNSFQKLIESDDISSSFQISDDLTFLIMQYKYLQESNFKFLMNLLIFMDEDELLTSKILKDLLDENFEAVDLDNKTKFLVYIFLNILKSCEIPHNEAYLEYLKKLYLKKNKGREYDRIVRQGEDISQLMTTSKNLFTSAVVGLKKKKGMDKIINDVLKFHINKELTSSEYDALVKDIKIVNQIVKNQEDSYELFNQHINKSLSKQINKLVNFDLVMNQNQTIEDLTKKLKSYHYPDKYIKQQIDLYKINEETKISEHIYIQAPRILKDKSMIKILLKYKEWIDRSDELKTNLNVDIKKDVDNIFQNIISKTFQHFFRALQVYLDKEDNEDYNNLFYFFNDNKQVRVHTENSYESLLLYVRDELNKNKLKRGQSADVNILSFIAEKLHQFLFSHEFYSKLHEEEIVMYDIVKYDRLVLVKIYNIFSQINDGLKANKKKQLNIKQIGKALTDFERQDIEKLHSDNVGKKVYIRLDKANKQHKVLSEQEMRFLAIHLKKKVFDFLHKTIKSGDGIVFDKDGLEWILKLINIIKAEVKQKYSFNAVKQNINKVEYKKVTGIEKHLNKLLKGEYKIMKGMKVSDAPTVLHISNENQEYGVSRDDFRANDSSYIELQTLKRFMKDEDEEKYHYDNMITNLVKSNFDELNKVFGLKLGDEHKKTVIKMLQSNDLKVKGIQRKLLQKIKLDDTHKINTHTNSVIQDIVKELSILYFADKIITSQDVEKFLSSDNLLMVGETAAQTIVKKDVLIKSTGKMGKIVEKIDKNNFKVRMVGKGKDQKMNRSKFIIIDSLKHKMVKITKGNFKGEYGFIREFLTEKFLTRKEKQSKKDHIKYLKTLIANKTMLINKIKVATNDNTLMGNDEFKTIKQYRTKEINRLSKIVKSPTKPNLLMGQVPMFEKETIGETKLKQRLSYLKLNKNMAKILSVEESIILEPIRVERIKSLQFSIRNLDNELQTFDKPARGNYNVRVRYGQKNERTVFLGRDDIKLNLAEIEKEEALNEVVKKVDNIKFANVYQMVKYLYNNLNTYITPDTSLNKTQYYHVVYTNTLKLLNEQKLVDVNKFKAIDFLKSKLQEIEAISKKITEKMKKKKSKKLIEKMSKNNKNKAVVKERIAEKEKQFKDINEDEVLIKKTDKVSKYGKDIELEKLGDKHYVLFKTNSEEMKKELDAGKKLEKAKRSKEDKDNSKIVNALIKMGENKFDNFMAHLNADVQKCDILSQLTSMGDYGTEDYFDIQEEIDEDELSLGEIEELLDEAIEQEPTTQLKPWEIEGRAPTWLELDDEDDSESDMDLDDILEDLEDAIEQEAE